MPEPVSPDFARPSKVETVAKPNHAAYQTLMDRVQNNFRDPVLRPFPSQEQPNTTMAQRGVHALLKTYMSPHLMNRLIQEASGEGRQIPIGDLFKQLAKGASIHNLELSLARTMSVTQGDTTIADTVARYVYNVPEDQTGQYPEPNALAVEKLLALEIPSEVLQTALQRAEQVNPITRLGDILHEAYVIHKPLAKGLVDQLDTAGFAGKQIEGFIQSVLEKGLGREKLKLHRPSFWKKFIDHIQNKLILHRAGTSDREISQMIKSTMESPVVKSLDLVVKAPNIYAPQRYQQAAAEFYRKYPQGSKVPQHGVLSLTPEQEMYIQDVIKQGEYTIDIPAFRKSLAEMNYNWLIAREVFGGKTHKTQEEEYFN